MINKNRFKINYLCIFIIGLFLYIETVAPHTIYSQVLMIIAFLVCFFFGVLSYKNDDFHFSIKFNPLIICYLLYIIYQIVLLIFGEYDKSLVIQDVITMFICLLISLAMYNYFISENHFKKFELMFISVGILSAVTILYLCRDNIGVGRLAHSYNGEGQGYSFLGVDVMISSNGLASIWAISSYFCLNKLLTNKSIFNKFFLFLILMFLSVCVFLTGSRKGFLVLIICLFLSIIIYGKGKLFIKFSISIVLTIVLYYVLTKIDFFRNVIGERLEILVKNIFDEDVAEGSMTARKYYADLAISAFSKNKLIGYGLGWFNNKYGNVTENEYLEILVSGGILGFIVYFAYIPITIFMVINKYRRHTLTKENVKYLVIFISFLFIIYGTVIIYSRSSLLFLSMFYMSIEMKDEKCFAQYKLY